MPKPGNSINHAGLQNCQNIHQPPKMRVPFPKLGVDEIRQPPELGVDFSTPKIGG